MRTLLDEQRDNTALIDDGDVITVETDAIIWSYITQAVDEVHLQAQAWLINDVVSRALLTLDEETTGTGKHAALPDDFLRLVRVKAGDWQQAVYDAIDPDSEEYLQQSSRWAGVRGNTERPVVAVVPGDRESSANNSNALRLEVWTTGESDITVDYVQRAQISDNADPEVTIAEHCYRPLLYTLAKHYLLTVGDTNKAALFGAAAGGLTGADQASATAEE